MIFVSECGDFEEKLTRMDLRTALPSLISAPFELIQCSVVWIVYSDSASFFHDMIAPIVGNTMKYTCFNYSSNCSLLKKGFFQRTVSCLIVVELGGRGDGGTSLMTAFSLAGKLEN